LDIGKLDPETAKRLEYLREKSSNCHGVNLSKGMVIEISCDYCKGSVGGKAHVLKFGSFERFFCCTSCKTLFYEKYRGKIESYSGKTNSLIRG
jgi:Lrp/AsnC family leucine-responsive transcriptional regulator